MNQGTFKTGFRVNGEKASAHPYPYPYPVLGQGTDSDQALRLDSLQELGYLVHGGVLPFVIRKTVQRTRQGALDD